MMTAREARHVLDCVREGQPMPAVKIDEALFILGDTAPTESANCATIGEIVDTHPSQPWATSTGLIIGCLAPRKRPALSRDDELLQSALLEPRTAQPLRGIEAVAGAIWKWL